MFTGIIEGIGKIIEAISNDTNKTFWIQSPLAENFTIDESICHDGVCLTVEEVKNDVYRITAIKETLDKTNLNEWTVNTIVNLERALQMNGRIDGHIVQGHIDTTAVCIARKILNGSNEYTFKFKKKFSSLIIEKGSVCVNGVSLTVFNSSKNTFTVAIIPYTLQHTNLSFIEEGSTVNIEFDMLGKYINKIVSAKKH